MEQLKYRRVDWKIEFIIIIILFLQLLSVGLNNSNRINIVPTIIDWIIYLILSIIMYYSVSPSILFKKLDNPKAYGIKFVLTQNEILAYIKKGVSFTSLFKLCILLIPVFLSNSSKLFGRRIASLDLLILLLLFFFALMMIIRSIQLFIKARGYKDISFQATIKDCLIYYNPDDKRAIVDKQFGIGSTINFASKDGRLVLYVIIAIPATVILMLLIALKLARKL